MDALRGSRLLLASELEAKSIPLVGSVVGLVLKPATEV